MRNDGFERGASAQLGVAMRNLIGNRNHRHLLKKITGAGLVPLLLVAGLPPQAAAQNCQGWNTAKFFETATADEVRACLSAGQDPNERDRQRLTALHRAARDTSDPAVIEALLDAGANPRVSSRAGRTPWYYARTNDKIKGSAAYERLRMAISSEAKKVAKKADWSRVQAVPSHRKTVVRLYEDAAPLVRRRIKGRFDSATADSITLVLKSGQTRTVHKQDVRKVRTWRPLKKRKPGWIALGVAFAITEFLINIDISESRTTASERIVGHAIITLVPTLAAFSVSGMGTIYDLPPKHRMLPQGDQ